MTHHLASLVLPLAVMGCAPGNLPVPAVRPGIEVLLEDSAHLISGRRLGILTNQTGVDRSGLSDVERLLAAGAQVTAILSPEHGYRGVLDQARIGHGVDSATGKPIYSLFGNVRAPTSEMLAGLDVILIDLHDIGARPYTFVSTTLLTMQSAQAHGVRVVILDRPNPIGGVLVQGPILDTAYSSFVGMLPVPLRHGMTLGELARYGNDQLGIGADLTVVPADGWLRDRWFDQTGLPWVRPSPSMPSVESATHYPGTVLFEATNLSVGRGTPIAFRLIGAPWLDAPAVVRAVGPLPGIRLADTVVTPVAPPDGKYGGQPIAAVRLHVTDRSTYDPVAAAVALLVVVRARHGDALTITDRLDRLAGSGDLRAAIARGESAAVIIAQWREPLQRFLREREPYLLYP